ncbi:MAG: cell wall hydrolase, partial [Pseudomonadota bacterium]
MEPITDESTPKSENNQDIADIISSSLDKEFNQTYAGAYSSKDLQCLAEAVYYEARGEGNEGGIAVAEVVLNRTKSKRFPSTICGVVYDKYRNICQFSFACNGSMSKPKNRSSWSWAKNIANKVVEGRTEILSDGALFFHADYVNPSWANKMVKTARIGTHSFYRHR